jgi:hypothetical protein
LFNNEESRMDRTARIWFAAAAALAVASFGFPLAASAERIDLANANIRMAWNSCYGTAGAAENLHYACDGSNAGSPLKLVFSFELPNTFPTYHFSHTMATIAIRTADGSVLPDYWRIQYAAYGGCRVAISQLGGPYGFTAFGPGVVDADHCASWYDGVPAFAINEGVSFAYPPAVGSDRIKVEAATAANNGSSGTGIDMPAGSKLAAGAMLIDTDTGSGGCAGCQQEMTIELVSMDLYSCCGIPWYQLTGSGPGTVVSWQANNRNGTTVARNKTWGSVKALYR